MAEGAGERRLTTAAFLTLTTRGVVLPQQGDHPEVRLDPADLAWLADAAAHAPTTPPPGDDLAAALEARRWLVAGPRPARDGATRSRVATDGPTAAPSVPVPAVLDQLELVLPTPTTVAVEATGFVLRGGEGQEVLCLDAPELVALGTFRRHVPIDVAHEQQARALGDDAFDELAFDRLVRRALAAGAVVPYERGLAGHDGVVVTDDEVPHEELRRADELSRRLERALLTPGAGRTDPDEAATKVAVVPVTTPHLYPNLALGLLLANAAADPELVARYDLGPHWGLRRRKVRALLEQRGPSVLLSSDYVWSSEDNLAMTRLAKDVSPDSVVVHGGPNVPRHPDDVEVFLRANPHVDVVVRNEGEQTVTELLHTLPRQLAGRQGVLPVDALGAVAGITFRDGDRIVRTPDRDRIADLDALPSPYLEGLFDEFDAARFAIVETNRGCPYGCTFCDWGSATLSRIRSFSLERVFAELEWIARHQIPEVVIADANFGIHARDVEIAEHIAAMKDRYGFPKEMRTNYAKNTNKHLEKIIRVLVDHGVSTEAVLSLQTTDEITLEAVRRSNIKTGRYDELAATFRRERLPLTTELMMGLPGATVASFDHDLQRCIDREIPARIYRTELLVNSPMNAPDYRAEHHIAVESDDDQPVGRSGRKRPLLVATASYTEADLREMVHHRELFHVAESFGLLRHVSRFVRQESGRGEVDLFVAVDREAAADPEAYPHLAWALGTVPAFAVPPQSWELLYDDLHRLLTTRLDVEPSTALDTVLAVQVALAPDRDRALPARYSLPHDYVAWWRAMVDAKEAGPDWVARVPRLHTFEPGVLEVDDPADLVRRVLGRPLDMNFYGQWDLHSPVSRAGAVLIHG